MLTPSSSICGKRIVIVGGLGHLGSCLAQAARSAGALTAIVDSAHLTVEAQADVVVAGASLANPVKSKTAFRKVIEKLGSIDALYNVAGGFEMSRIEEGDLGLWTRMFEANLLSTVGATIAAVPYLNKDSLVVNTAAAAGARGSPGMGAYSASKAGVIRFTETLGAELQHRNVRVYSVAPSILDTPRNRHDMPDADRSNWLDPRQLAILLLNLFNSSLPSGANIEV